MSFDEDPRPVTEECGCYMDGSEFCDEHQKIVDSRKRELSTRCELSDLLISECGCRIHAKTQIEPEYVVSVWFNAAFNSRCSGCRREIKEGDRIARTTEGEYVCEWCAS